MMDDLRDNKQSACSLLAIPPDILRLIANYLLLHENEQDLKIFKFSYEWRNFTNSSKSCLAKWKKASQLIILIWNYADVYQNSSKFRERILQSIEDPFNQLELHFTIPKTQAVPYVLNLKPLKRIKKLIIENCSQIIVHPIDVDEFVIRDDKTITDFSFCSNTRIFERWPYNESPPLDLSHLRDTLELLLMDFRELNGLDFPNLKTLCTATATISRDCEMVKLHPELSIVWLHQCSVPDISIFRNTYEIKVSCCDDISDVSSLRNVHRVMLVNCANIREVSDLGMHNTSI
jgi:hypothetical protein